MRRSVVCWRLTKALGAVGICAGVIGVEPIVRFQVTACGPLSVLKARSQLESTAEIGNLQRLILPLNRREEGSSWYLNENSTQVLKY